MEYKKKRNMFFRHLISMPFIWFPLIGIVIMDIMLEIYHRIGFRLYGIELVKRRNYIKFDRHKLKYLTIWQKIGCMYCSYANGFFNYASEVAGRTEKYWCGIKHRETKGFVPTEHQKEFVPYNNEAEYRKRYIDKGDKK